MPRIFESIARGVAGAGRAIRGGVPAGGAQQVTPAPPSTPSDDDTPPIKRNAFQRFGSRIKRDAMNAPAERGLRALVRRSRRPPARGGSR